MDQFLQLTVVGLVVGCVYALAATGLVVTYTTSGVFNFAHGAVAAVAAFGYWDRAVAHHWPPGCSARAWPRWPASSSLRRSSPSSPSRTSPCSSSTDTSRPSSAG